MMLSRSVEPLPPRIDQKSSCGALWRKDAEDSYSDWTLKIIYDDEDEKDTSPMPIDEEGGLPVSSVKEDVYHVHRCIIASGDRKCDYFQGVFKSDFSESTSKTSTITLHPLAAKAVPAFLDYIYTGKLTEKVCDAITLYFLSEYFGNDSGLQDFGSPPMDVDDFGLAYETGKALGAQTFLDKVLVNACSELISSSYMLKDLMDIADEDFVYKVTMSAASSTGEEKIETLVTELVNKHLTGERWDEAFHYLTSREKLSSIATKEFAWALLVSESEFRKTLSEALPEDPLSDLQERCLAALESRSWEFLYHKKDEVLRMCKEARSYELCARLTQLLFSSSKEEIDDCKRQAKQPEASRSLLPKRRKVTFADETAASYSGLGILGRRATTRRAPPRNETSSVLFAPFEWHDEEF